MSFLVSFSNKKTLPAKRFKTGGVQYSCTKVFSLTISKVYIFGGVSLSCFTNCYEREILNDTRLRVRLVRDGLFFDVLLFDVRGGLKWIIRWFAFLVFLFVKRVCVAERVRLCELEAEVEVVVVFDFL